MILYLQTWNSATHIAINSQTLLFLAGGGAAGGAVVGGGAGGGDHGQVDEIDHQNNAGHHPGGQLPVNLAPGGGGGAAGLSGVGGAGSSGASGGGPGLWLRKRRFIYSFLFNRC